MNRISLSVFVILFLSFGCNPKAQKSKTSKAEYAGRTFFEEIDTNFVSQALSIPGGKFKYDILFSAGDLIDFYEGGQVPSKKKLDLSIYLPVDGSSEHGHLWINHEETVDHPQLGQGGGATILEVKKEGDKWVTLNKRAVDFSHLGGTAYNCLGGPTPMGTVLTSEEFEPSSNQQLAAMGMPDTNSIKGMPRYLNYGWMVEVDPSSGKAIRKLYQMGRFMHEGVYCMPDSQTIYLLDDAAPGVFFKFVANKKGDYGEGQLYAYKQSADGRSGKWLPLPMNMEAMISARNIALQMGATIFIRLEDLEPMADGSFLMTETGIDITNMAPYINLGGVPARHLRDKHFFQGIYSDLHGRILRYDPKTEAVSVYLEAGPSRQDEKKVLSNPDNMAFNPDLNCMIIHEDINGTSHGRVPMHAAGPTADPINLQNPKKPGRLVSEVYMLDLEIENPKISDLRRFAISPAGGETTGPSWTPDGKTLFFNIQHPSPLNPPPFDKACTIAVTGF